jgi:hypothetical protein
MELEQGEGSGLRDASARRGSGVTGTVPRVLTRKVEKSRATAAAQSQNQEEQLSLIKGSASSVCAPRFKLLLELDRIRQNARSAKPRKKILPTEQHNRERQIACYPVITSQLSQLAEQAPSRP